MIKGTLADKIFGLKLNPVEKVFYEIGKSINRKVIYVPGKNVIYLYGKNIAYIDNTIFTYDKNKDNFIENIQKELQEEAAVFDISHYIYITSLQGKTVTDIENPLFPHNLYHDIMKSRVKYIILFFDPDMIGTKKLDTLFNSIKGDSIRICIGENYDYGLLKYKYIRNIFMDIKKMVKI